MSEKSGQLPLPIQNQNPETIPQPLTGELGAIDFNAVLQGAAERANQGIDYGLFALHGVSAWVADRRASRAEKRAERMEHKDALYAYLGEMATTGTSTITHRGETPRPRTFIERRMDKKLEKRQFKHDYKQYERDQVIGRAGMREASNTMGIGTKLTRRVRLAGVGLAYRRGEMTAAERRVARRQVDANPVRFETPEQRRTREELHKAAKKVRRSVRQPVLSRWRSVRRDRAIDAVPKQRTKAQRRRDRASDALARARS